MFEPEFEWLGRLQPSYTVHLFIREVPASLKTYHWQIF